MIYDDFDINKSEPLLSKNNNNEGENKNDSNEISLVSYIFIIAKDSFPISLNQIFSFLLETINIFYIGKFNNTKLLNSVGLGNSFFALFGPIPLIYIQGGIDTLCSISFGMGKYSHVGLYVSISKLISFVYCIFIYIPLLFLSKLIFQIMNIDIEIQELSYEYILYMTPSLFFFGLREINVRYLQSMLIFSPSMITSFIVLLIHPFFANLFIVKLDFQIKGAGFAMFITNFINFLMLEIYILWEIYKGRIIKETFSWITKQTFSIKYISKYLYYAIPSLLLGILESLSVETLIIISSLIGVIESSAIICFMNFMAILYLFVYGISASLGNLIGNAIGEGDIRKIRTYIKAGLIYTILIGFIFIMIITFFKDYIIQIYTKNNEVVSIFKLIITVYSYGMLFDYLVISLQGVNEGLGKQRFSAYISFSCYFLVALPLFYLLVFTFNYGIYGLIYGQFTYILTYFIIYISFFIMKVSVEDTMIELNKELR